MLKPEFSAKFMKLYEKIPFDVRRIWPSKLALFLKDFRHPSLRVKKMKGYKNIWEMSINMDARATFEMYSDKVVFRKIGDHSILLNP